jgi:hypothetical protein
MLYVKTISSGKNYSPTFLWYDMNRIENGTSNNFFVPVVTYLPSHCLATINWYTDLQTLLWCDTDCIENEASNNSSIVACLFVAAGTFLRSRCLETYTDTLMGGVYEIHRSDVLRCHGVHTKFHKYWFKNSQVKGGGDDSQTHGHSMVIS